MCAPTPHTFHTSTKTPSRLRFENIYSGDSRDKDRCKIFSFDSHLKQLSTAYCPAVLQNNYAYIMQRKKRDLSALVVVMIVLLQHVKAGRHEILMWPPTCLWTRRAGELLQMADQHARNSVFARNCCCAAPAPILHPHIVLKLLNKSVLLFTPTCCTLMKYCPSRFCSQNV